MTVGELIERINQVSDMRQTVLLTSPEWPYEMQVEEIIEFEGTFEIRGLDPRTEIERI